MIQRYAVVFEHGPRNWSAYSPDVPGCVATGKTLNETRGVMREALEAHLRWIHQDDEPIPVPRTQPEAVPGLAPADVAEWLEVDVPAPAVV